MPTNKCLLNTFSLRGVCATSNTEAKNEREMFPRVLIRYPKSLYRDAEFPQSA